jgi:hypothetical protein
MSRKISTCALIAFFSQKTGVSVFLKAILSVKPRRPGLWRLKEIYCGEIWAFAFAVFVYNMAERNKDFGYAKIRFSEHTNHHIDCHHVPMRVCGTSADNQYRAGGGNSIFE